MNRIIDEVYKLSKLSSEDLTEKLCEDKYNKANLRELARRAIQETETQRIALTFYKSCLIEDRKNDLKKVKLYIDELVEEIER